MIIAFQIKARDPAPSELFHKVGVTSQKVSIRETDPRLPILIYRKGASAYSEAACYG